MNIAWVKRIAFVALITFASNIVHAQVGLRWSTKARAAIAGEPPRAKDVFHISDEPPLDRSPEHIMQILDNAFWIPDGHARAKQIYVFSAPWCGYCQYLFKRTRGLGDKVQIRWIETGGQDPNSLNYVGAAALKRDPKLLDMMYRDAVEAPAEPLLESNNANDYNQMVQGEFGSAACDIPQMCSGYPTVVWLQADGVHHGNYDLDVQSILPLIVDRLDAVSAPPPESLKCLSVNCVKATVNLEPIAPEAYFANWNEVYGHPRPDIHSPVINVLQKNDGWATTAAGQTTVNGEKWIKFCLNSDHTCTNEVYVRDKDLHRQ